MTNLILPSFDLSCRPGLEQKLLLKFWKQWETGEVGPDCPYDKTTVNNEKHVPKLSSAERWKHL